MRALKTVLIIVVALVVFGLLLGLVGPKHSHVERSVAIGAPQSVVWNHVATLRGHDAWSPFRDLDPAMKVSYEGEDGALGSKSTWEGPEAGKGMQEITAVEPGKSMMVGLHFMEPFSEEAEASIALEPAGDSTKVTWAYDGENSFIARIMCVFKDMDAMMGPVFASGLSKLKQLSEADAAKLAADLKARTFRGYEVDEVDRPAVTYCGIRNTVKWADLYSFFSGSFHTTEQALGQVGMKITGAPAGLFYKWDEAKKSTDVMAAMPVVADSTVQVAGCTWVTIPAGKALKVTHHGNYDNTQEAHHAMDDMMKVKGLQLRDAVIEEYVTDPGQEPDTAKWLTNIYYPVR
ncbi:MAG: SRPBCC family protein [Flavobacteriales bacterium]|nr:SRPBCC family protein [Flavobacteriales bacterium]